MEKFFQDTHVIKFVCVEHVLNEDNKFHHVRCKIALW